MASPKLQPVRGTHDILPEECRERRFLTDSMRRIAEHYGYGEIATPIFEFAEVFQRTLGDTSDVVTKETYSFEDRGGELLTLRPEFTASIARAFISNGLADQLPLKFFYAGPAFRYERPQKGRMRQFHQVGVELLGVPEPQGDIESIALAYDCLRGLGLADKVELQLNSLGCSESRAKYREQLVQYLRSHESELSEDSKARLERNPLRVLDSKDAGDRAVVVNAPRLDECFTPEAQSFFKQVCSGLTTLGINYTLNHKLVRGLDYYSHTVFEFVAADGLGAQNTVLAGGRYDGLVEMMGGPATAGIGWAAGVERLLALVDVAAHPCAPKPEPLLAIVPVGETAELKALTLAHDLRRAGLNVDLGYRGNLAKRMKRANKIGATHALILGDDELQSQSVTLRDLATGEQQLVPQAGIATLFNATHR